MCHTWVQPVMRAASWMLHNMSSKGKLTWEQEKPFIYMFPSLLPFQGRGWTRQTRQRFLSLFYHSHQEKELVHMASGSHRRAAQAEGFTVGISMVNGMHFWLNAEVVYLVETLKSCLPVWGNLSCIGTQPLTCACSSPWDSCNESCVRWLLCFESFCPSGFLLSTVSRRDLMERV